MSKRFKPAIPAKIPVEGPPEWKVRAARLAMFRQWLDDAAKG